MKCPALILCSLCVLFASCKPEKSAAQAPTLPEFTVSVGNPQRGNVPVERVWVGNLVSMAQAPIIPQIKGYIEARLFTNGQRVEKGQELYHIQPDLYAQALEQAQQELAADEAKYKKALQDEEYYKPLVESGSISRQTYTDALQSMRSAEADVATAKAKVAQAKTNLNYCTLTAPMDGVVGFAKAFVGNYVSPESSSLVLVNVLNPIRVYFSISEQDWINQGGTKGSLHPGAKVKITLSNGQPYPQEATIAGVDNLVSTSTGSLMLDARIPNPDDLLRPGMYVLVHAQVEELKDALMVPVAAVAQVQGKSMILAYDEKEGSVSMIPVTLGPQMGDLQVITKAYGDLKENTLIITKGTQQGLMAAMKRARLRVAKEA